MNAPYAPNRHPAVSYAPWQAELRLAFDYRAEQARTVLATRQSTGPLRVQKALWPEPTGVCHVILLHPPAGIAGGDELQIAVTVGRDAHALLTTPGAGKWYKSDGRPARQQIALSVAAGGLLEWLPQEVMLFDQAIAHSQTHIHLAETAAFIGWEILVIGRPARAERYAHGQYRSHLLLTRAGRLLLDDRLAFDGGDRWLASPLGLAGQAVSGMLLAVPPIHRRDESLLDQDIAVLRDLIARMQMPLVVTRLDDVVVARYLGADPRQAMDGFAALRAKLRRHWFGLGEELPRIWRT